MLTQTLIQTKDSNMIDTLKTKVIKIVEAKGYMLSRDELSRLDRIIKDYSYRDDLLQEQIDRFINDFEGRI